MSSTAFPTEEFMQRIRENRSSESNFELLVQQLEKATGVAQQANHTSLSADLQEVNEKYVAEYRKSKENGGTAWPEFEKFVTQFERVLMNAGKEES
jgi:hypothetical protein